MALWNFFKKEKSKEDKFREQIRSGFDESVKNAVNGNRDLINDPLFGGMLVQGAIGNYYQSMKSDSMLWLLANQIGLDYDKILEDECNRALKKYLE